ncbi:ABC transporter ATP-binding protein [Candidatus Synechococcus spongiarum]|uniref:ABC transporter ATP-binding protein n=1 Tax=Candidatus Synechococcus spongiarum TaxID=431041 RepID=A0A164ZQ74_9SYNE|nr:ABC transporter ATP-binding protein [Candidatus Synechococcus spongiarum]SAY38460.1 ABC transporter ATP-binding protein [Candidatus Synechococcus spongiarum]
MLEIKPPSPLSPSPRVPLRISDLRLRWPSGQVVLNGCSLELPHQGLWMLVGANGSGKSTLLRVITDLIQPDSGRVECYRPSSLVFQNPDHQLLLPSCGADLQLGMPSHLSPPQRQEQVGVALERVGLQGFGQRPIHTLSGGQKQRLAIATALASDSRLLLLDEPTALLDPQSQQEVLILVRHLCSEGLTALWVTHRLEELDCCDGAFRMDQGTIRPARATG